MQGAVVMLLALSGLGCQNPKEAALPPPPPGAEAATTPSSLSASRPQAGETPPAPLHGQDGVTPTPGGGSADVARPPSIPAAPPLADGMPPGSGPAGEGAVTFVPPPPYPVYSGGPFTALDLHEDNSFGSCVRNTFWSFFIGRDPNVPSASEIEAAYQAGLYNH